MQLFDAEGRRLYVTEEERRAFRAAASKAPREVVEPAVSRPELAFRIKLDELLGILGEAIARIEQLKRGSKRRCVSCGLPSWRSRPRWHATRGSGWRLTISMRQPGYSLRPRVVAQRRWM